VSLRGHGTPLSLVDARYDTLRSHASECMTLPSAYCHKARTAASSRRGPGEHVPRGPTGESPLSPPGMCAPRQRRCTHPLDVHTKEALAGGRREQGRDVLSARQGAPFFLAGAFCLVPSGGPDGAEGWARTKASGIA
jgi:hypothetical protein